MRKFLSEDEIVEALLDDLPAATLESLKEIPFDDLISTHHGLGQWIRNTYGLWSPDNPHTVVDCEPNPRTGLLDHPDFPDQMSHRIIERVWGILHEIEPRPLERPETVKRSWPDWLLLLVAIAMGGWALWGIWPR